jgi:hypothetical protein
LFAGRFVCRQGKVIEAACARSALNANLATQLLNNDVDSLFIVDDVSKFDLILKQITPKRIHRSGETSLRHLGEIKEQG